MKKIKVIQFGLGPIGIESLKLAAEQSWLEVTGVVVGDGVSLAVDATSLQEVEPPEDPYLY